MKQLQAKYTTHHCMIGYNAWRIGDTKLHWYFAQEGQGTYREPQLHGRRTMNPTMDTKNLIRMHMNLKCHRMCTFFYLPDIFLSGIVK